MKPSPPSARSITIDTAHVADVISPLLFGHNLEHTRRCVASGLSAQLLRNRKFFGEPSPEGVPFDWYAIGPKSCVFRLEPTDKAYTRHVDVALDLSNWGWHCDWSVQRQKVESWTKEPSGIGQRGISLFAGRKYTGFLAMKSDRPLRVTVRLLRGNSRSAHWEKTFTVKGEAWTEVNFNFPMPRTDLDARFEITIAQPGVLYIGASSLMPADNFHGMRSDVVELLKRISVPILRWPGGNFAGDYRWKDGLLSPHQRAGLKSYGDITQRLTHNYDAHEIGTDEFIALCRELGAEPSITINVSLETPQDAADWVEYCNGSTRTKWGRVRAQRGHAEPYNVKYWSLGNEMGYGHMKGPNRCEDYCKVAHDSATAMRKVDPGIVLTASGAWTKEWIAQVPPKSYRDYELISHHRYVFPLLNTFVGEEGRKEVVHAATMPDDDRQLVDTIRQAIQKRVPKGRPIGIAYDEWNMWYAWYRRPGVVDAIYAAGFLHMLCRSAVDLGISLATYFQPVNEGAILVEPSGSFLTPVGHVFEMMKIHQNGKRVAIPDTGSADIDALASIRDDGATLNVTLVNRSPDQARQVRLSLGSVAAGQSGSLTLLSPDSPAEPSVEFTRKERRLTVDADSSLRLELPRFAVASISLPMPGRPGK